MPHEEAVLKVALEVGRRILICARGDPARTVAYGLAAAVAVVGVAAGYGAYVQAQKAYRYYQPAKTAPHSDESS